MDDTKTKEPNELKMHGNKDIFQERLKQGFTTVSFGTGEWIDDYRIAGVWIFKRPTGKVATLEYHEARSSTGIAIRGVPEQKTYTRRTWQKYAKRHKIKIGAERDLAELLANWDED